MTNTSMEVKSRSVGENKKMEGEDSLRTLECLRGRLLAERQSSKVANEEAELMGNKLIEIGKKIKEETRLRKKAEKKLKLLMKKIESLQIAPTLEGSEQSSSSENSKFSSSSSSSTSVPKESEEFFVSKSHGIISAVSQDTKDNFSETSASNQNHCAVSIEENLSTQDSQDSSNDHKSSYESNACPQGSGTDDQSCLSLKSSVAETERSARSHDQSDNEEDYVDNFLALVPVSFPESTKKSEIKIINTPKSVSEVLDALRHAREQIQSSMERRQMIRVGPT